jgi:DNA sulfur modification protein DndB
MKSAVWTSFAAWVTCKTCGMGDHSPCEYLEIPVLLATAGHLQVVLGSAPARDLYAVSFADVLDEEREVGYQRPFDQSHARDFRAYIDRPGSTTIPLTFNLRGRRGSNWDVIEHPGYCRLRVRRPGQRRAAVMARVDCQHRLGMMSESSLPLTFQCYLGLSQKAEMEIFHVINAKAKGLSSSLLDYHVTVLARDTDDVPVELFIAKRLHDDPRSVWHKRVNLGGAGTQGTSRRTSLRGLQSATRLLLQRSPLGSALHLSRDEKYAIVRSYWDAVASVWQTAWENPRANLITKGIGVTALSLLGADLLTAVASRTEPTTRQTFESYLARISVVDWSSHGAFRAYGGRRGAQELHQFLRSRLFALGLTIGAAG